MMDMLAKDFDNADTLSIDTLALEEIILEERAKEISDLNHLSKKVCHLHTSLLYYRNTKTKIGTACYETWRMLIRKVGGSPDCWRALGHHLGISQEDLDYIRNSVKEDPTDIVLKLFLQDEKATLDKIIDAFIKLKRYDILKAIEEPLCDLAQCFNKDDSKSDTGYSSNSKNSGQRDIISFTKQIPNDLPPALNKNYVHGRKPNRPNHNSQSVQIKKFEKEKNDKPILFLTYAEDGFDTALNIQDKMNNWPEEYEVTVITLNNRKEEVLQNPERFIREYYEKADFIVPIISTGYLNEIQSHSKVISSTNDNLDYKYVGFIYNLIINSYIAGGCFNEKVRSILPEDAIINVHTITARYSDLTPWTPESMFDEQFICYLQEHLKKRDTL